MGNFRVRLGFWRLILSLAVVTLVKFNGRVRKVVRTWMWSGMNSVLKIDLPHSSKSRITLQGKRPYKKKEGTHRILGRPPHCSAILLPVLPDSPKVAAGIWNKNTLISFIYFLGERMFIYLGTTWKYSKKDCLCRVFAAHPLLDYRPTASCTKLSIERTTQQSSYYGEAHVCDQTLDSHLDQVSLRQEPQGCNQPNPECGKFHRTNEPVSSNDPANRCQENKVGGSWECYRLKEIKETHQPNAPCGLSLDHGINKPTIKGHSFGQSVKTEPRMGIRY